MERPLRPPETLLPRQEKTPSDTIVSRIVSQDCAVSACGRPVVLRGWCRLHYQRWRKHGDPARERPTVFERLMAQVERTGGCWQWRGAYDGEGYGLIRVAGTLRRASRVAWEATIGPIPTGLSILHACDNPSCVRPDHLMLGTQRANIRDMLAKGRRGAMRREIA